MKTRLLMFALAIASLFAFSPAFNTANAAITKNVTATVIGGTLTNATFTLDHFVTKQGQLYAVGTLTGTLTNTATGATQTINQLIEIPVTNISGSCKILHLELGPLDLDLLGLQVHLDKIVLDITAQRGPGNLLGNLLCAIAGLLNGSNINLTLLTSLLNQVVGIV